MVGGAPAWLWGSVRGWGAAEGGTDCGETALRLAKNPMLPFKLAMKSRRMGRGRERGRVNFRLKFSFIIQVTKRKKLNGENNNQQHSKISRLSFLSFPHPRHR